MTVVTNNNIRTFGTLSYGSAANGFYYEFPPTYTLSFTSKPIIGDNGVAPKYTRNELTVSWFVPYDILYTWSTGNGTDLGQNPPSTPYGGASPNSIDTAVQRIKSILMRPRLLLRCEYQGLGPQGGNGSYGMTIDSSNDVNFGPIPQDFKWRNIASQRCVELTWIVAFHTLNQIIFDNTNTINKVPSVFNEISWSRSYDIDELGAVTITTSGRYSLNSYMNAHSDQYRVIASFPVPLYCMRLSKRFQHDPSSKSTTFTIVDKQHLTENALPPKALKMDLTHEVSSAIFGGKLEAKGFITWNNIIQGTITLPPGEPFITAYFLFQFYVRQRMYRIKQEGVGNTLNIVEQEKLNKVDPTKPKTAQEKSRTILTRVSYKEALFDRTHSFRAEYLGVYSKEQLIQQSGLFTPLYNYKVDQSGSYRYWYAPFDSKDREPWHGNFPRPTSPVTPSSSNYKASLADQWDKYRAQFAPYIYGYLGFNEDNGPWVYYPDDQQSTPVSINKPIPGESLGAWVTTVTGDKEQIDESLGYYSYSDVDPQTSYMSFENTFSIVEDVNTYQVVRQRYDSSIDSLMKSYNGANILPEQLKNTKTVGLHAATTSGSSGLQASDYVASYNSQPITRIVMSGFAVRAGYPPTIPLAFRYKNTSLVRSGQSIVSIKQIAKGTLPIYLATWSIPYYANTGVHTNFFDDLEATGFAGDMT